MTALRPLCHRDTLADGQARGFDLEGEGQDQFFLVGHGGALHAWRNACPHVDGAPMAWRRDAYLSPDGRQVMCHAHGARFEPDTGRCVQGPCLGQHLQPVPLHIDAQGQVWRAVDWAARTDDTTTTTRQTERTSP
ncbi:Rieske (2Fe-2S) protein [Ideonella sp. B508-1]|uniref:Rieske (2Fe-2S) protein n=1 Tax=Ideonella sp. B508-1 TaxID=137716 RepID=UPI000344FE72|nr:Rieske (2Fe-2S) protein [Ideonella sp. B508-1]